jgi:hypothetical protein
MSDEKKKVSAWVDVSLVESLRQHGYNNLTEAIITGFKMIIANVDESTTSDNSSKASDSSSKDIDMMEKEVLKHENVMLKDYNDSLKKELEDLKSMHNNYMLQMQTLINQKAIEAPGAKKPWWRFW